MDKAYVELAKLIKGEGKRRPSVAIIGQIIAPLPHIKVKIHDRVVLDKDNLVIGEHVYSHYKDIERETCLGVGDEVSLLPTSNSQVYYLVDKVVRP